MGKIKILAAFLLVFFAATAAADDGFKLKLKPPIPGSNPAEINPGCDKCEWEIYSSGIDGTQGRRIKAVHMGSKYRLEIKSQDTDQAQVIIFDNAELYILNPFFKTAALYYLADTDNLRFLDNIFPGIGLQKKDRSITGRENFEGRVCDVVNYRILKRGKNMFVWGTATEWLDKDTGRTLKVETLTDAAQIPFNGKMMTAEPVRQVYKAGRVKGHFFMDGALFKVPQGYKILDMKKIYDETLEKEKGIKPGTGFEMKKVTIQKPEGKK